MTYRAMIRFARCFDMNDVIERKACMAFDSFVPLLSTGVELWIDHDRTQTLGRVKELFTYDDVAGARPKRFHAALADLEDPPGWIRRGTPVSLTAFAFQDRRMLGGGVERVARAGLQEISFLTPSAKAAEPYAQVVTFGPKEEPKTISRHAPTRPARTAHAWTPEERRHAEHLAKQGLIFRPASGQVLAVR